MRRMVLIAVTATAAISPGSRAAYAAPLPTVTVATGPSTPANVFGECTDVVYRIDAAESFVVQRDTPDATPLSVRYSTKGQAKSGLDFAPLSGSVTIPANALSATVTVTPLVGTFTHIVDLTVTVAASPDHSIGEPSHTTIRFVVPRDPALGPADCNPHFQVGPDATNHEQTIRVGEKPVEITTTAQDRYWLRLVDGSLPPGVTIEREVKDGPKFLGVATATGTYAALLDVCPAEIVFTCRRTTLVLHVLAATVTEKGRLPRTGSSVPATALAGLALLFIGAFMARASRRTISPNETAPN